MLEIVAEEARNSLNSLLDRVQGGEEVVITRHGYPVARLVRNGAEIDRTLIQGAMERIRARASALKNAFDLTEFKEDRDTGRP